MDGQDPMHLLEHEFSLLFRRSRAMSGRFARELHPEIGASAYNILLYLQSNAGSTDDTDSTGDTRKGDPRRGVDGGNRSRRIRGTRLTDLAAFFGVGKPTLSRQVRPLERLGFVERVTDSGDARAIVFRLSSTGAARLAASQEARRARFRSLLRAWPTDDVETFATLLHRFNELAETAHERPQPGDDPSVSEAS